MKTRFISLLMIAAMLTFAVSCSDDDEDVLAQDNTEQNEGESGTEGETGSENEGEEEGENEGEGESEGEEGDDFGSDITATHDSLTVVYFGDVLSLLSDNWWGRKTYTVVISDRTASFKISSVSEGYPDDLDNLEYVPNVDYYAFFIFSEEEVSGDDFAAPEGTYTIDDGSYTIGSFFGLHIIVDEDGNATTEEIASGTVTIQTKNGDNIVTVSAVDEDGNSVELSAKGDPRSINFSTVSTLTSDVTFTEFSFMAVTYSADYLDSGCGVWQFFLRDQGEDLLSTSDDRIIRFMVMSSAGEDTLPLGRFPASRTLEDGTYVERMSLYMNYGTSDTSTLEDGYFEVLQTDNGYEVTFSCYDDTGEHKISGSYTFAQIMGLS